MEKELKYYYVADAGTATYAKLDALAWKRLHAWTAARAFTRKVGGTRWNGLRMVWAGGIRSVVFENEPPRDPEAWVIMDSPLLRTYRPRVSNAKGKALYEEMTRLPRVGVNEVNAIIGFTDYFAGLRVDVEANVRRDHTPAVHGFGVGAWLVDTHRCRIPADVRRVTEEEFNQLTGRNDRLASKRKKK